MRNIAVIGAGQIGSRHIQALGQLTQECSIYVLDGQPAALAATRARVAEANPSESISHHYLSSVTQLPEQLDLAIIATSAEHRLAALTDLVAQTQVTQLILEKVLFQQLDHYELAQQLLQANNIKAWVNCPRRMMPSLTQITKDLTGDLSYQVTGSNWGMGCNAIHFIDHCAMLARSTAYELDTTELEPRIHAAKRPGCIEFSGVLKGYFKYSGSQFRLHCDINDDAVAYQTEISSKNICISYPTPGNEVSSTDLHKGVSIQQDFSMPYQSELTQLAAASLFANGYCELPTFQESMALHLPFIEKLLQFTAQVSGISSTSLNIT